MADTATHRQPEAAKLFIRIWLLLLVLVAVFIRVYGANDYYYSPDEAMHSDIAEGADLSEVLKFSHYEAHPPVSYILFHYWMAFSHDPAFVRGLSLVFGVLLILVYFLIGKKLNGELTGLACAALVTFGTGCIIQSYVVRQYNVFLLFISLAYYCYLHWRSNCGKKALAGYVLFAVLACLSHFSAVFSVSCLAAFGMMALFRQKTKGRIQAQWVAANAFVVLVAIYAYYLWQPILIPLKYYAATRLAGTFLNRLMHVLFYPLVAPGYILGFAAALILLLCQIWVAVTPPKFIHNITKLRSLLLLNAGVYAVGMFMAVTRIYPEPGHRHSLWILPFVVPLAGWMLADFSEWLAGMVSPSNRLQVSAMTFLIAGCVIYTLEERFSDGAEYVMPQEQWHALNSELGQLGPHDLIVTDKDDGIMFANLYRYMGNDAFSDKVMATLVPWQNTHIVFNPYYVRYYSTDVFLATLEEAKAKGWFDDIDRVVFLRLAWSRSPVTDLMLCPALNKKQITGFPPFPAGDELTRLGIYNRFAVVMTVSKETFMNDILSPTGKAHVCLNRENDAVPDLRLPVDYKKPFLKEHQ